VSLSLSLSLSLSFSNLFEGERVAKERNENERTDELTSIPFFSFLRCSWLALEKLSRVPIGAFKAGLTLAGVDVEAEEVECMVANMIYKVSPKSLSLFLFFSPVGFLSSASRVLADGVFALAFDRAT